MVKKPPLWSPLSPCMALRTHVPDRAPLRIQDKIYKASLRASSFISKTGIYIPIICKKEKEKVSERSCSFSFCDQQKYLEISLGFPLNKNFSTVEFCSQLSTTPHAFSFWNCQADCDNSRSWSPLRTNVRGNHISEENPNIGS